MREEDPFLTVNLIPTIGDFLRALGIKPGGLGAQLFTRVYDDVFVGSVDLRSEYEKFYCVEYPTLKEYLETAHEIYLDADELEKKHILKFKPPAGVVDQNYDDNTLDAVVECIKKLETMHEN